MLSPRHAESECQADVVLQFTWMEGQEKERELSLQICWIAELMVSPTVPGMLPRFARPAIPPPRSTRPPQTPRPVTAFLGDEGQSTADSTTNTESKSDGGMTSS